MFDYGVFDDGARIGSIRYVDRDVVSRIICCFRISRFVSYADVYESWVEDAKREFCAADGGSIIRSNLSERGTFRCDSWAEAAGRIRKIDACEFEGADDWTSLAASVLPRSDAWCVATGWFVGIF